MRNSVSLVCWSLTSLCHSNGQVSQDTMIDEQSDIRLRLRPLSHRAWLPRMLEYIQRFASRERLCRVRTVFETPCMTGMRELLVK